MVLSITDGNGRPDQGVQFVTNTSRNNLRADRIRADQAVRAVLLGRADWNNDAAALLQALFDFLPGAKM